jgi:hypothetical protein
MFLYGDKVKIKGKLFNVINIDDSDNKNIKYLLASHNKKGFEIKVWYLDTDIEFVW